MEKDNLKIDILFPYYGDVELMKLAVQSILEQSYENWRLLVFDDGMPGNEVSEFFSHIIEQDEKKMGLSRISYERNKENLGANKNFQKALNAASSEYYVMMGADDLMHSDFLEGFIEVLSSCPEKIDIYQPMVDVIDENGKSYLPMPDRVKRWVMPKKSGIYKGEAVAKSYLHGWHYFPSMIWRREIAQKVGFNANYVTLQDVYQGLDILQLGGSIYFDANHTSFSYRRHSKSDSSIKALNGIRFEQEKDFYNVKAEEFLALGWKKAAKSARRHYLSRLNALSLLPKAISSTDGQPMKLLNHILNLD